MILKQWQHALRSRTGCSESPCRGSRDHSSPPAEYKNDEELGGLCPMGFGFGLWLVSIVLRVVVLTVDLLAGSWGSVRIRLRLLT